MANLFQLKTGKLFSFIGKLAEKGFTAEMAEAVDRDPDLAAAIVIAIKRHPSFALVHGLFNTPEEQIARVRVWNKQFGWGISDEAFAEAERLIPMWPEEWLAAVTLVPYLTYKENDDDTGTTGLERTFNELWMRAKSEQDASWRDDYYDKTDLNLLRLLNGNKHPLTSSGQATLRWEVIDLGCQRGEKPCDVRSIKSSPHAGILASAALHPRWIKNMNGKDVPYVWLPGYEISVSGRYPSLEGVWTDVPGLHFVHDAGRIRLSHDWYDRYDSRWAVPSFVGEPIPIL